MAIVIAAGVVILVLSNLRNNDAATEVLIAHGYTQIAVDTDITDVALAAIRCGTDETAHRFVARKADAKIAGTVCCRLISGGCVVRL